MIKFLKIAKETDILFKHYSQQLPRLASKNSPQLVIVTKNQSPKKIHELLILGHLLFGENRIQEAISKWPTLKLSYTGIKLHMIGALQTNKVSQAVALFDVIESIDRFKLASALQQEMIKQNKTCELYVQVNIGLEPQKSGISPLEVDQFIRACKHDLKLSIVGIMCIAPINQPAFPFFALLREIAKRNNLNKISMGMSQDYATAIEFGSTELRIGSSIFN